MHESFDFIQEFNSRAALPFEARHTIKGARHCRHCASAVEVISAICTTASAVFQYTVASFFPLYVVASYICDITNI